MIVALGNGKTELTGPVVDGYSLRQIFIAKAQHLSSVSVLFSTYKRKNHGQIIAEILDRSNRSLGSSVINAEGLADNKYHTFNFSVDMIPGGTYEFRIRTSHCRSGMAPTAHHSFSIRKGESLFVAGHLKRHRELVCTFEYGALPALSGLSGEQAVKQDGRLTDFLNQEQSLSVIVLTKNGYDLITMCMDALLASSCQPDEIIIGDTGTTDERVLAYYETLPEHVRVVGGLQYDFSKANNKLAEEAIGTHLLFLNNDVFLEEDSIAAMMDYSRLYSVGAVGLRLLRPRGVIEHDGQILFRDGRVSDPGHVNINWSPDIAPSFDSVTEGVTAACMLTPKSLFTDLGGFDEGYDDVYQDCDYCLKLTRNGFSCVTVRSEFAIHVGSATRGVTQEKETKGDRDRYHRQWDGFSPSVPKISFITCCSKPDVYAGLLESLPERVSGDIEMVPLQNSDNRFTVTQALNIAKTVARGEYLAYCHQDVLFSPHWVAIVLSAIRKIPNGDGMIGFEGLANGGTPYSCNAVKKGGHIQVQTLDELCIITRRRDLYFDEGFKFHYYGADICMQAEEAGLANWLIGVPIKHLSGGAENVRSDLDAFKKEAETFRKKWRDKDVWTTTTKFLDGSISYMILADELNEGTDGKD